MASKYGPKIEISFDSLFTFWQNFALRTRTYVEKERWLLQEYEDPIYSSHENKLPRPRSKRLWRLEQKCCLPYVQWCYKGYEEILWRRFHGKSFSAVTKEEKKKITDLVMWKSKQKGKKSPVMVISRKIIMRPYYVRSGLTDHLTQWKKWSKFRWHNKYHGNRKNVCCACSS